jgi:hypothetical protein
MDLQCFFRFWCVSVTVPWPYRDRDFVNVSDRDLVQYDRFRPFTVLERSWAFSTVYWAFTTVLRAFSIVSWRFFAFLIFFYLLLYSRRTETEMKSLEKLIKRSGTVRNDHETLGNGQERSWNARERSGTVNGQEWWTVNGQGRWTVRNGQERWMVRNT